MIDSVILMKFIEPIIEFSFSRSSGPGGQNVNKLNTKVTARLEVDTLYILTDSAKNRVRQKLKNRINDKDEIIVHVQEERTQGKNREIALKRMHSLILCALHTKKQRVPTKPSKKAKERRLELKRRKSILKKQRQTPRLME
jgi:ribosome-associated protein